jgi:hypothetical protein
MNNDNMTFTVTAYGKTVTITQPEDIDIYEFLDTCRDLAIAMRYLEDSWKDAVVEMANDYLIEEEKDVEKNMRDYGNYTHTSNYKTYTGKSDLITHWGPLNKYIPDTNC